MSNGMTQFKGLLEKRLDISLFWTITPTKRHVSKKAGRKNLAL